MIFDFNCYIPILISSIVITLTLTGVEYALRKQKGKKVKIVLSKEEYVNLVEQFNKQFPNDVNKIRNKEKAVIMKIRKHLFVEEMENGDYDNKSNSKNRIKQT